MRAGGSDLRSGYALPTVLPTGQDGCRQPAKIIVAEQALLSDGVSRTRGTVIAALAGRHPKDDVRRTLMRLAVTERLVETGGKYTLPAAEAEPG
jgi:hypothetical protein